MAEPTKITKSLENAFQKKRDNKSNTERYKSDNAQVQPQARDLEELVLGAIMLEQNAFDNVSAILKSPDNFYVDAHQRIYSAMIKLTEENEPIDMYTVTERLRSTAELEAVGGAYFIASLTNKVASSANIEAHARIVVQKFLKREVISVSSQAIKDAFDETVDVFDLLDSTEAELFKLTESNMKKSAVEIGAVVLEEVDAIGERRKNAVDGEVITGVGTGFKELDKLTSGWQKSDLIVLAARPGMGKTAFTLALARNAAIDAKKGVAFFSLEMSTNQLVSRLISMETEISSDKIKKGLLLETEWKHLVKNIDNLKEAPIFIDDTPAIGIFELRAKCRRLKAKHDIQMIMIDYLQLMTGSVDGKGGGNREQEISMISRNLKGIAKELSVPIIALSQLSRAVETRGGAKRPMLSDLRESGAIEQDADMVIFLYRPEYYKITQDEDGLDCRGIAEVIIAKHRNGSLETIKTKFIGKFAKFQDLENNVFDSDQDFGGGNTITQQSKMNSDTDDFASDDFPVDDDTPF
ncbi:MAG: replicative DNA helicase [Chitinophagales bacterium]